MYEIFKYIDMHMTISIITSVGIIMAFLGIFFFTYASIIEQNIVEINTNIIVNDLLDIINPLLDNNAKTNIINNIKYPNMDKEDADVNDNNSKIVSSAFISLLIIFIITICIGFGISYYTKNNFWEIIGLNLIILICVGLTEYTFLHLIPKKFIAADTNYVRYQIIKDVSEKLDLSVS